MSYLEQWFDFSGSNVLSALQFVSLKQLPSFQQLFDACRVLKLTSSIRDMDRLYDEYSSTKAVMQGIVSQSQLSVSDKWVLFFCSHAKKFQQLYFSGYLSCCLFRAAMHFRNASFL